MPLACPPIAHHGVAHVHATHRSAIHRNVPHLTPIKAASPHSAGGTLILEHSAVLGGAVGGWAAGDIIDVRAVAATAIAYAGGTLTLYGSGHVVADTIVFQGTLSGADFAFGTDGHGGTDLTDPAHNVLAAAPEPLLATHGEHTAETLQLLHFSHTSL